jgi:hypothetical protein
MVWAMMRGESESTMTNAPPVSKLRWNSSWGWAKTENMPMNTSSARKPKGPTVDMALARMFRCVVSAPLGRPVVPEV